MGESGGYSTQMKRHIRRVFWLYFALFALLTAHLIKLAAHDGATIAEHPANPRLALAAAEVVRGRVLDKNGEVLAESSATGAGFARAYPYGAAFAHLVGFEGYGRSGVESVYNLSLQKLDREIIQRANNVLTGEPLTANSLVLTADAGLQDIAVGGLEGRRGAVVALEPSTGKVLAMASRPSFDPNALAETWEGLTANTADSPLLNRAAQGLYPPGSVFKLVTAAAAMETMPDWAAYTYNCAGQARFGGKLIHCFNGRAHGDEDIVKAFAQSCNGFFSTIGVETGGGALRSVSERLLFNADLPFPLEYSRSSFALTESSGETDLVETAIGQGKTLVSPLHMAMLTAAVANGGVMMQPYVADHGLTPDGRETDKRLPVSAGQPLTLEEADFIKNMMVDAVETGTASPAAISGVSVAAKTGTAENASGDDHGWFVAFAPADKPSIAVAIVLENSGGPREAMKIAKSMIEYALAE